MRQTLFTRAIRAKTALSVAMVTEMPSRVRARAVARPSREGQVSTTITLKRRLRAAALFLQTNDSDTEEREGNKISLEKL